MVALPSDHPRSRMTGHASAAFELDLAADLQRPLADLWRADPSSAIEAFVGAWVALVYRYTQHASLRVGIRTPGLGRFATREFEGRADRQLGDVGAGMGVEISDEGATPPPTALEFLTEDAEPSRDASPHEVRLVLRRSEERVGATLEYDPGLFGSVTVERWAAHYLALLRATLQTPQVELGSIPLLTAGELHQLDVEWASGTSDVAYEPTHRRFERLAHERPDAVAVAFEDRTLSYAALDEASNRLAHHISASGSEPGTTVAVCVEPSVSILVAILAIFKAGCIYVPVDPHHPPARIRTIVDTVSPRLLLTQSWLPEPLGLTDLPAFCFDRDMALLEVQDAASVAGEAPADQPAYVFFTSGTTGQPKGVVATHGNLAHYLSVAREKYGFTSADTFCSIARFTFSISMFELLSGATCGGRLQLLARDHILDMARLTRTLRDVTVLHAGPSLLKVLLRHLRSLPEAERTFEGMRHASSGGDLIPPEVIEELAGAFPRAEVFVIYGCTEISCMGCTFEVPRGESLHKTLVGQPFPDMRVRLVDSVGHRVPLGVVGEIVFAGRGLTQGYLGDPKRTEEKFVAEEGDRWYHTGDLGRMDARGDVEILGRQDFQVQIGGIRVELGEVETWLKRSPGVRDAIVADRRSPDGEVMLVGYLVPEGTAGIDKAAVRSFVSEQLPDYEVPRAFVVLDRLPLNHNLKVDRRALPDPTRDDLDDAAGFRAARTDAERLLVDLYRELLGVGEIGIDDDLLALGATSLVALRVNGRLHDRLGVAFSIGALFGTTRIRDLASELERLLRDRPEGPAAGPRRAPPEFVGLSHPQFRIWYSHEFADEALVYNVPQVYELAPDVDAGALERALGRLVERHEILRTVITSRVPDVASRVLDGVDVSLEHVEVAAGELDAEIRHRLLEPFVLRSGPLFRATLFRVRGQDPILFFNFHHAIYDELSARILRRELGAFYDDERAGGRAIDAGLGAAELQYRDYAYAEREAWEAGELAGQMEYWKSRLSPLPPDLDLPLDHPRPSARRNDGASVQLRLEPREFEAVKRLALACECSPFVVLVATWTALLHRHTTQTDIVVGAAVTHRTRPELEGLIGCFVNLVALRSAVDPDLAFDAFVAEVRKTCHEAISNGDAPFNEVVRVAAPPRNPARTPLFSTMFVYEDASEPLPELALGLRPRPQSLFNAHTDVSLWARNCGDVMDLMLSYDVSLFEADTMRCLLEQLHTGLARADGFVGRPVSALDFVSPSEAERQRAFNATAQPPAAEPNVVASFLARVAEQPGAPAVDDARGSWTYGEIARRADRVSRELGARGIGKGDLVGICAPRTHHMVVAVLGILRAGAGYVPLDPAYPAERLAHMVDDSRCKLVLGRGEVRSRLPSGATFVDLEEVLADDGAPPRADVPPTIAAGDVAYVIYTSGSTGLPKGVAVPHGALQNFLGAMRRCPGLHRADVLVAVTTLSFDISVLELLLPLSVGARVFVVPDDSKLDAAALSECLTASAATVFQATPTTWRMLLDHGHRFAAGFRGLCGGEPMPPDLAAGLLDRGVELWNMYGPTETTVWSSCERIDTAEHITVGRPIDNTSFYVLDDQGRRQPIGVPGELYIGGAGVTLGYLDRESLTKARFVADPFGEAPGDRMYRTGDRVRLLPDGRYAHQGRLDGQVKLRGFRIELGEIESVIRERGLAADCAVCVRERSPGDHRLVAFVVSPTTREVDAYRQALGAKLPAYMLPQHIVPVDELPRTPNRKLDRGRVSTLPVEWGSAVTQEPGVVTDPTERSIARLFATALGVSNVGVDDDFFALGGHSLLAVKVAQELCDTFGMEFPVGLLFESPTVRAVAEQMRSSASLGPRPILLNGDGSRPPLYLLVGVELYRPLATRLRGEYSVYGVYVTREGILLENPENPPRLTELARDYVELLTAHQPKGPYRLGGASFGGILAYEVAQQLVARGEEVEHLLLLDAVLPELGAGRYLTRVRRLLQLPYTESVRVAIRAARALARQPWTQMDVPFGAKSHDDQRVQELDEMRFAAYRRLAIDYAPSMRPFSGRVTLVAAGERLAKSPLLDPKCGWQGYARDLETVVVNGDHLSVLREPAVEAVASAFRRHAPRRDGWDERVDASG